MRTALSRISLIVSVLLLSCGDKTDGDRIVSLAGLKGEKSQASSSGGDATASGSSAGGTGASAQTGGTCKPSFSFTEAQQKCVSCHSSAMGNAKWSTADGTEADWKMVAAQLRASVEADRMPMPALSATDKDKFIAFIDGLSGSCTPEASTGGNNGGNSPTNPINPNEMSLAEAKAQCAGCHMPGGMGASVWDKANGTEEDWRSFAPSARASVSADRMPPPNGMAANDKTRMIGFLDKLLGDQANQPLTYTLDTAKALCVGCHSQNAAAGKRESPNLDTLNQWKNNKADILDEVEKGKMPRGKTLSSEEKRALLDFINSL